MSNTHRKHMRIPNVIMEQVEEYKEQNGILNTTSAFLELVRKGLETEGISKDKAS